MNPSKSRAAWRTGWASRSLMPPSHPTAALAVQKNTTAFTKEIVVLSLGGGDTTRIADAASDVGVGLSTFSADTTKRLEALLPDFGAACNPVDGTGRGPRE
ncbi:MAG: hypothetical protein HC933_11410, partial [Pleurocapsa sp. SU_196_0]|nr:hypothetical protein [Pleurocapsa sp. SU_196_0]